MRVYCKCSGVVHPYACTITVVSADCSVMLLAVSLKKFHCFRCLVSVTVSNSVIVITTVFCG